MRNSLAAALCWLAALTTAGHAGPRHNSSDELSSCNERVFVGKRIEPKSMAGILQWSHEKPQGRWKDPELTTPLQTNAQVVLLHLWAHWCEPCKRDFPVYAALSTSLPLQLAKTYGWGIRFSPVQFLYLAEDTPTGAMNTFLKDNQDLMRGGDNFQDTGGQLKLELQRKLGCSVSLPLTLLLDKNQRVEAAFAGSITDRREELLDALVRMGKPNQSKPSAPADVAQLPQAGNSL